MKQLEKQDMHRTSRGVHVALALLVILMSYHLFTLASRANAATSGNLVAYTTVSAGVLQLTSASTSNSFTGVSVLFTSQTATMPDLGAIRVSDARGSGAGWTVAFTGTDWKAGEDVMQLDYDGTGSNGNLGKMCI